MASWFWGLEVRLAKFSKYEENNLGFRENGPCIMAKVINGVKWHFSSGSSPLTKWNLTSKTVTCFLWQFLIKLCVAAPFLIVSKLILFTSINYVCADSVLAFTNLKKTFKKSFFILLCLSRCSGVPGPLADGRFRAVLSMCWFWCDGLTSSGQLLVSILSVVSINTVSVHENAQHASLFA